MRDSVREFLQLLGASIGEARLSEGFSVADGGSLLSLASRQGLAGAIAPVLAREGLLDGEALAPFLDARLEAIRSTTLLSHELSRITAALDGAGIDYIPLKGAHLRALWPSTWMRTSCDVDILIREDALARACDAVTEALGYTVRSVGFRDASLYAPGDSVHLELHFSIRDTAGRSAALGAAWDYAVRAGDGHEYRFLPHFEIFYLLFHLLGHMDSGGGGVRPVIDLALLRREGYDAAALAALLADCGLTRFAEAVFSLGDAILSGGEIDGACAALAEWLIHGELYGEIHRRALVKRAKGESRLSRRVRRRYVLSRLFPRRRELAVTYPALQKHVWLYPFGLLAWHFHLIFGGRLLVALRRRRAEREVRAVSIDSAVALFAALGIDNKKTP